TRPPMSDQLRGAVKLRPESRSLSAARRSSAHLRQLASARTYNTPGAGSPAYVAALMSGPDVTRFPGYRVAEYLARLASTVDPILGGELMSRTVRTVPGASEQPRTAIEEARPAVADDPGGLAQRHLIAGAGVKWNPSTGRRIPARLTRLTAAM